MSKGNGRYGSTGLPRTTLFDIIQFSLYLNHNNFYIQEKIFFKEDYLNISNNEIDIQKILSLNVEREIFSANADKYSEWQCSYEDIRELYKNLFVI